MNHHNSGYLDEDILVQNTDAFSNLRLFAGYLPKICLMLSIHLFGILCGMVVEPRVCVFPKRKNTRDSREDAQIAEGFCSGGKSITDNIRNLYGPLGKAG